MNEELKVLLTNLAVDLISKVQNGVDVGSVFVSEQTPKLIEEIVKIGVATSIFGIISFSFLTSVSFYLIFKLNKKKQTKINNYVDTTLEEVGIIFSSIGGIGCFIGVLYSAYLLVIRLIAPRMYIIEQLKILFQ